MCNQNNPFLAHRRKFQAIIQQRYDVDDATYDAVTRLVAPLATAITARKGEYLQHAGQPARTLYWITGGVARSGFTTQTGTEITITFSIESHSATPYHDLLAGAAGQPARYFVLAETALEGFRVDWDALQETMAGSVELQNYHMKILEYTLAQQARRGYTHLAASAADRLATFRQDFPGLEQRVSQKVIASYLEITPQYLSQLLNTGAGKP